MDGDEGDEGEEEGEVGDVGDDDEEVGNGEEDDKDEDEDVIALQAPPNRFQFADLEPRQNEILADQLLPFAL